jgi:peroxiredoxin Q/BCP
MGRMLETGTKAPEFTLPDRDGNDVTLSSLAGTTGVLYFYPKADTRR